MALRNTPLPLTSRTRATLFLELARLQGAGLPADRALRAMADGLPATLAARIGRVADEVAGGRGLAEAGRRNGVWTPGDRALIETGERGGVLVAILEGLARRYEVRATLARRMRARLAMPALVLALAVFAAPLPALVGGSLSAAGYAASTAGVLAALAGFAALGVGAWRRGEAAGFSPAMAGLVSALPVAGGLAALDARATLLSGLAMLLEAGMPAAEALPRALAGVAQPSLRRAFAAAGAALGHGAGVAEALRDAGVLDARAGYPAVLAGEAAGRLADALARQAQALGDALESRLEVVAQWLPRIAYGIVGALIAGNLLAG